MEGYLAMRHMGAHRQAAMLSQVFRAGDGLRGAQVRLLAPHRSVLVSARTTRCLIRQRYAPTAHLLCCQATTTGILPIRACHSRGPVWCTEVPSESTATVTGMSLTSNS